MKVYVDETPDLSRSVIAIGAFDGVHRGHQAVIRQAVKHSKMLGVPSVVYTFDPPPRHYFQSARILTTVEKKLELLARLEPDYVVITRFDHRFTMRRADDFIDELGSMNPLEISVGEDFRFGRDREGDVHVLARHFKVRVTKPVCCSDGNPISSTRIRHLLSMGDIQQSFTLLGWSTKRRESV
ncbi:FAD synthetase [Brevibacillus humidisoli]|uniref:FAD synthetase n=1 Tax=Brevibacillus humidisoli TaxID=2895522 RepID=UPI001E3D89F8|nr:FAD synthetase [Brevibacillus humidisoli]UFJ41091.1 FAD synthetase [Brevibacillus humidisoli]